MKGLPNYCMRYLIRYLDYASKQVTPSLLDVSGYYEQDHSCNIQAKKVLILQLQSVHL